MQAQIAYGDILWGHGIMNTAERFEQGSVRGFLHRPSAGRDIGVVLAHGAGANCDAKVLQAVAEGLCASDFFVLRIDLPFRHKRPSGPPFPAGKAADLAGLQEAAKAMRSVAKGRLVLGGHSYGGRLSTMLVADDATVADGLLLLSYPLHPPAKPEQLRTAHFPELRTPALFVHGTRDPFGSPDEMRTALQSLRGPVIYNEVAGAGHDLRAGKFDVKTLIANPLRELMLKA